MREVVGQYIPGTCEDREGFCQLSGVIREVS